MQRQSTFTFRVSLVSLFSSLIVVTAFTIVHFADQNQRHTTLDLYSQLVTQLSRSVIQQTTDYLKPAPQAAQIVADQVAAHPELTEDSPELMRFMASILKVHKQLASVYVGDQTGRMFQLRRETMEDTASGEVIDVFVRRRVDPGDSHTIDNRMQVSTDGNETVYSERVSLTDYDPRTRPWYQQATEQKAQGWTDAYIFHSTGTPGLTAFQPIQINAGGGNAVVGADIGMGALSKWLSKQKVSTNGLALVFNDTGKVVAHPDAAVFRGTGEEPVLPDVGSLDSAPVQTAVDHYIGIGKARHTFEIDDATYMAAFIPFPETFAKRWTLLILAPEDDFLGRAKASRRQALLISLAVLLISIMLANLLAKRVSNPIMALSKKVDRVRNFHLDNDFGVTTRITEVATMSDALTAMQAGLNSFSKFVPRKMVRELIEAGEVARLGGEVRHVTILFTDIRGYSTIVEHLPPAEVVNLLDEYLGTMHTVIERCGGCVLEYTGDGIMAVFGAPAVLADHAVHATRSAIEMRQRLEELNEVWSTTGLARVWQAQGIDTLRQRVGIHTGNVLAGNLGSSSHMKYSMAGDTVNISARLEQLNKQFGTNIMISADVFAILPADLKDQCQDQGEVQLKGRAQQTRVYTL